MSSMFTWVDFAEDDRRKMADVIALFAEKDTRDELGSAAFATPLPTCRPRQPAPSRPAPAIFLFIPWIYQELERRRTLPADIERLARRDEICPIHALENGGETDGIIGTLAQDKLARLPSSIYWAGLGRLGHPPVRWIAGAVSSRICGFLPGFWPPPCRRRRAGRG